MIYAAPPVEVRPQRIIHLEGETLTAMCRVGVPISYCRWTVPGVGGLNLNPRLGPHEGIKYQGRSLENVSEYSHTFSNCGFIYSLLTY